MEQEFSVKGDDPEAKRSPADSEISLKTGDEDSKGKAKGETENVRSSQRMASTNSSEPSPVEIVTRKPVTCEAPRLLLQLA